VQNVQLSVGTGAGNSAGRTVITADPVVAWLDAVMVAVPAAIPLTTPAAETVARDALSLVQITLSSGSGWPAASFATAVI
jgi:hypothetical protein